VTPLSFVVVGAGWRAQMFWRLAAALDEVRCVGAVVRTPRPAEVPTFTSLAQCIREARPAFVVTAVPWPATPGVIVEAVDAGLPVLAETPPAPDVGGLTALWTAVGDSGLVQVAEQYLLMPSHAARLAAVRSGAIGAPTQVQVSSTHQYHAVAMMRGILGVGSGPVTVRATRLIGQLVDPLSREGWTDDPAPKRAANIVATLDFGDGKSGVYDFTDNQWHNQLRFRRILLRGTHGELRDDELIRLAAPHTIVTTPLVRRQTGYDLNLDGFDTDHITLGDAVLYRNPFPGRRWMDEEIAMASLLVRMAGWVREDGAPPYPLAEGAQDHLVALAIEQAADIGREVVTDAAPWAGAIG
jgi:predicted dehydrogenase